MKYTVPEYARKFGYNETYVRHCCNGYIKPDSGWQYRLRNGHFPRLEGPGKNQWVIYVNAAAGERSSVSEAADPAAAGLAKLPNSSELLDGIRACHEASRFSGQPVKVQIEFHPDGSWTSTQLKPATSPFSNRHDLLNSLDLTEGTAKELIAGILLLELERRRELHQSGSQTSGRSALNDILQDAWVKQHPCYALACSLCLECLKSLGNKRKQARFCSTHCKNLHQDWCGRLLNQKDCTASIAERMSTLSI